MNSRQYRQSVYNQLYKSWPLATKYCAYCGVLATTKDHVPSLANVEAMGLDCFIELKQEFWLIPACHECNSVLSNLYILDIKKRQEYINKYLKRNNLRTSQPWSDDELKELGPNLKLIVLNSQQKLDHKRARIAYSEKK